MCQSDVSIFGIGLFLLGLGEWDSVIWGEKVLKSFANNTLFSVCSSGSQPLHVYGPLINHKHVFASCFASKLAAVFASKLAKLAN